MNIYRNDYKFLGEKNILFPFVPWFFTNYLLPIFSVIETDYTPLVSVIEREYKLQNGNIFKDKFPPQIPFKIEKQGKTVSFNAFSKLLEVRNRIFY